MLLKMPINQIGLRSLILRFIVQNENWESKLDFFNSKKHLKRVYFGFLTSKEVKMGVIFYKLLVFN